MNESNLFLIFAFLSGHPSFSFAANLLSFSIQVSVTPSDSAFSASFVVAGHAACPVSLIITEDSRHMCGLASPDAE